MRHILSAFSAVTLASGLMLAGCPAKVASVEMDPANMLIKSEAETKSLVATPKDAEGNPIAGKQIVWSSSDAAIATVDETGKVKPAASGKATITAKVDEAMGISEVTVRFVKAMKLESPAIVVKVGTPNPALKVTFNNEKGEPVENAEAKIEWSSADPNVATVGPDGTVTGVAPGSTSITAKSEAVSESVVVTVNPADEAPAEGTAPPADGAAAPAPGAAAPTK